MKFHNIELHVEGSNFLDANLTSEILYIIINFKR